MTSRITDVTDLGGGREELEKIDIVHDPGDLNVIESLTTSETSMSKVLSPDGAGGAGFVNLAASAVGYTPAAGDDWPDPDPTEVGGALDSLADQVDSLTTTLDGLTASVNATLGVSNSASPSEVAVEEIKFFEMSDGAYNKCASAFPIPPNIDFTEPITLELGFIVLTTGIAGDVFIEAEMRYAANGDILSAAADETIDNTVVVVNTVEAWNTAVLTLSGGSMSGNKQIYIVVGRDGNDGADTFTGDIGFAREIQMRYMQI